MPMYYDFTNTKRHRKLTAYHMMLLCEFLQLLREANYADRSSFDAPINELALDDLSDRVVNTWVLIRRFLVPNAAHDLFYHREGSSHIKDKNGTIHGHSAMPLFTLAGFVDKSAKEWPIDEAEVARAYRDLVGAIGLRVSSTRIKVDPKDVFKDA
jgi:hypothetical protein